MDTPIVVAEIAAPEGPGDPPERPGALFARGRTIPGGDTYRFGDFPPTQSSCFNLTVGHGAVILVPVLHADRPLGPAPALSLHPIGRLLEARRDQPTPPAAPTFLACDQPAALRDVEMLGEGGPSHIKLAGQRIDRQLTLNQLRHDRSADWVAEGMKGQVQ